MLNRYSDEQFSRAIHSMVVSPESLKTRIANAYTYHINGVKIEDVPEEIRANLNELHNKLTSVIPDDLETAAMASVENMTVDEAIDIANQIMYMADVIDTRMRELEKQGDN